MTALLEWLSIFGGAVAAVAVVAAAWLAGRWWARSRRRVDMGHADTAARWGDDLATIADAVREEPRPLSELTDAELYEAYGREARAVGRSIRAQRDLLEEIATRVSGEQAAAEAEDYLRGQA